jgi:hypothetical protein
MRHFFQHRSSIALIIACVALPALACDRNAAARQPVAVVIDTVDGIEHVRSSGEPKEIVLETVLEIGEGEQGGEPRPNEFAWVSSVSLGPDGHLYIADLGQHRMLAFDTTGALVRTIGRDGRGPGEFGTLYSIQWMGDTLTTMDLSNGRVGFFTRNGEWLTSRPARGRLVASPVTFRLYRVGGSEVYQFAYRMRDGITEPTWRHVTTADSVVEWLRGGPTFETPFPDKVVCTMGRGFSWFDHPYATRWLEHPAPGQRAYGARSDAYRIALSNAQGDTVRVVERNVEAARLNDSAWSAIDGRYQAWLAKDKDPTQCRPRDLTRPERKPHLEAIMVDVTGRLWVERNLENGTQWEIFDTAGRLTSRMRGFEYDRQRTVPWIGTHHIAWVTRDSLDVPRVHLARIKG